MSAEDRMIGSLKKVYGLVRFIVNLPRYLKKVFAMPGRESFYPEFERKRTGTIIWENLRHLFKYREVNPYYISYGFDVKNFRKQEDFLAHMEFAAKRNAGNQSTKRSTTGDYNYMVLLRDKYVFASYLASTIGEKAVIPTRALIAGQSAYQRDAEAWDSVENLLTEEGRLVFKVLDGECADGVMLTEVKDGELYVDGQRRNREEFTSSIRKNNIIVQDVVEQHEALKAFKTKSVNTIRIITIRGKSGGIGILSAFLRLSDNADSFVDNRAKGGLGIGIDIESGKLMKYGYPHDGFGRKTEVHSLSDIPFDGYQLPDWGDVKKLVIAAHRQFYELQSIGWDVVLTPDGPRLLEGNDDWEIGGPQDTVGGLRHRWDVLVKG